jgi:hypothetical protein
LKKTNYEQSRGFSTSEIPGGRGGWSWLTIANYMKFKMGRKYIKNK